VTEADAGLLTKIIEAATKAIEGEGAAIVVNLDTLEKALFEKGVPIKTLNRGALAAELALVREEISTQYTRAYHAEDAETKSEHEARAATLIARERELVTTLWPQGEPHCV
jgi:hypothetical protein